ncbi:hypothetical protein ACRPK2_08285 [Lactococcus garvieae]|uniref:hypothetical protein n=1 Tax=Lactococcus garvieae TaxID=1363 RepID=UPI003D77D822
MKEKLEQTLPIYGSVECVDHVSDDGYLSYDVCLKVESDETQPYIVLRFMQVQLGVSTC